jgi:ABC transporter with metal-binding/Fe-S-binding domain ATP-binding protein
MFHSVNIHLTRLLAKAWSKPIIEISTRGEKENELKDLQTALANIPIDGIISGAISSTYQRNRLDTICSTLNIQHFTPLWGNDPEKVLEDEVKAGMEIILSAVAARGLDKSWLGRRIDDIAVKELKKLSLSFGFNICGEGGEYESLVLTAPWLKGRLKILRAEIGWDGTSGSYNVKEAVLNDN